LLPHKNPPPPPKKKIVADNCLVQNLVFQKKQHQFQVQNALFVTPVNNVHEKKKLLTVFNKTFSGFQLRQMI
jgi:hypothetical protein